MTGNKPTVLKKLCFLIAVLLIAFIPALNAYAEEPEQLQTPNAWIDTIEKLPDDFSYSSNSRIGMEGYMKLRLGITDANLSNAEFKIAYPSDIVYDPVFWDPEIEGITRTLNISDIVGKSGWKQAQVTFSGSIVTDSEYGVLAELRFDPKAEGTFPVQLITPEQYQADPRLACVSMSDGYGPVEYGYYGYNDITYFTFTDKQHVIYLHDFWLGNPLTNGTLYAYYENAGREALNVTSDSFGGYFFDSVQDAVQIKLVIPGYDDQDLSGDIYHNTSNISPKMLMAYPHMLNPTNCNQDMDIFEPGIGAIADRLTGVVYMTDFETGSVNQNKTVTFAPAGSNQVKMHVDGGFPLPVDGEFSEYNVYIYDENQLVGRIYTHLSLAPMYGDMNGDWVINIDDLIFIAQYYGKAEGAADWEQIKQADLDYDQVIDSDDLQYLKDMYFSAAPPAS